MLEQTLVYNENSNKKHQLAACSQTVSFSPHQKLRVWEHVACWCKILTYHESVFLMWPPNYAVTDRLHDAEMSANASEKGCGAGSRAESCCVSRFYQGDLTRLDAAELEASGAENGRSGREETGTEPASTSGSGAPYVCFLL